MTRMQLGEWRTISETLSTTIFWFVAKLLALLFGTVWIRASLPRLRYDQLMDLGWKWLIELAFLWIMVSGTIIVARDQGWNMFLVVPGAVVGAVAVLGLLRLSMPKRSEFMEEIR